jgi:hypothetical protein|tara:strand:+ start:244 stop:471 length:228 start_codon:yes stop_codon:yes gene_type:complete
MKKSELRKIIKEEIKSTLNETDGSYREGDLRKEDFERVRRYLGDKQWMSRIKDRDRETMLEAIDYYFVSVFDRSY